MGLRGQLHAEAEKTLEEIVVLTMLTACAAAGDVDEYGVFWCVHHSDTVRDASSRLQYHEKNLGHRGLDTAAREWASHDRGWDYGRGAPKVEGSTETTGESSHAVGTLDTRSSEQQTDSIRQWEVMQWPWGSSSVEAECPNNALEGMEHQGSGKSEAGFYVLV